MDVGYLSSTRPWFGLVQAANENEMLKPYKYIHTLASSWVWTEQNRAEQFEQKESKKERKRNFGYLIAASWLWISEHYKWAFIRLLQCLLLGTVQREQETHSMFNVLNLFFYLNNERNENRMSNEQEEKINFLFINMYLVLLKCCLGQMLWLHTMNSNNNQNEKNFVFWDIDLLKSKLNWSELNKTELNGHQRSTMILIKLKQELNYMFYTHISKHNIGYGLLGVLYWTSLITGYELLAALLTANQ